MNTGNNEIRIILTLNPLKPGRSPNKFHDLQDKSKTQKLYLHFEEIDSERHIARLFHEFCAKYEK